MDEKETTEGFKMASETAQNLPETAQKNAPARKKRSWLTRIITGAGIFAVLAVLLFARFKGFPLPFDIVVFLLIFIGTLELTAALKEHLTTLGRIIPLIFSACLALPYYVFGSEAVSYYLIFFLVLASSALLFDKNITLPALTASFFSLVYPTVLLFTLLMLNNSENGFFLLVLLFLTVCFSDIFAYSIGSTLGRGRRKLCPDISPNKTYIGACGGILGGLAGSFVAWLLFDPLNLFTFEHILFTGNLKFVHYFFTGILLSLSGMAGDLFASLIKRKTGIKDYGKIFPGHGGVLDRFDAIMFAAVVLTLYTALLF